jgi:putative ABC transport system permease protein
VSLRKRFGPLPRRSREEREHRLTQEMDEEIRFHLEMRERELTEGGMAAEEARAAARARFGDVEGTVAACARSDQRREAGMTKREIWSDLARDARIGLRQLRRRPVFTVVAVATLAIGIGANTAIFSAVDHVLLRPLPYLEPERVVTLWETDRTSGAQQRDVAPGNFVEWKARATTFEALGLAEPTGYSITEMRPAEAVQSWAVTEGWFEALGVRPVVGRLFTPEEYAVGRMAAVMISHEWWVARYGGDPGVVGRTIELDDAEVPIVGVLPRGLDHPIPKHLWSPKTFYVTRNPSGVITYDERTDRASSYMVAVGRLRPGVSLGNAEREMEHVSAELAAAYPQTNAGVGSRLVPLREKIVGEVRPALFVLLATVGFVLLIACANVTSLLLARAAERSRELRVRSALGAERGRLVSQLLIESLMLALVGGAGGLAVAWLGLQWFVGAAPTDLPRAEGIALDGRILAFSAAVTVLTALVFGLAPALQSSRADPATGGQRTTASRGITGFHRGLVVSQIALALVLLIGAGLLGRSFLSLTANDVGFVAEQRATLQLFLWDRYPTAPERVNAVAALFEKMRAVPGVTDVAVTSSFPFHPEQIDAQSMLEIEGRPPEPGQRPSSHVLIASPNYFDLMGMRIVRGRGFTDDDRLESPRVVVINETLAARFFPGEDPVGQTLNLGAMDRPVAREIVGVVNDVRAMGYGEDAHAEAYVPYDQQRTGSVTVVAAIDGSSADAMPALRQAVAEFDAEQPIYLAFTVEQLMRSDVAERRFNMLVLASLAAVALALSAAGIYGLLSYATAARTTEIGIRMAMGAQRGHVVGMIVRQGLALTLAGVAVGLAAAAALTRFMAAMLYGVEPLDLATFAQLAGVMTAVAALASWIPARRASRAHPAAVLRE